MIAGAHVVLFSTDAAADRSFLADTFGFSAVDAGGGWLILELPPAELAVHPTEASAEADGETDGTHRGADQGADGDAGRGAARPLQGALYLMCDDIEREVTRLAELGVHCLPTEEASWGRSTHVPLPSGGHIGLYQPSHPTALRG